MQTKNAIGNLMNRYRAVLKKCNLLNTFGTLALASAFAMSGAGLASAAILNGNTSGVSVTTEEDTGNHGAAFTGGTDDLVVTDKDTNIINVTGTLGTVTINAANSDTTLTISSAQSLDDFDVYSGNSITLDGSSHKATMVIDAMYFMQGDTTTGNIIKGTSSALANQEVIIFDTLASGQTGNPMYLNKLTLGDANGGVTVTLLDADSSLIAGELDVTNGSALNADVNGAFNIHTGGHDFSQDEFSQVGLTKLTVTNGTVKAGTINVIGSNPHDKIGIDLTANGSLNVDTISVQNSTIKGDYELVANNGIKTLEFVGATIVDGDVTVNGGTLTAKNQPVADGATKGAEITGVLTVSDGTVNIENTGDISVAGGTAVSGGEITVNGTLDIDNTGKALDFTGGTITVAAGGFLSADDTNNSAASTIADGSLINNGVSYFDDGLELGANTSLTVKNAAGTADIENADLTDGTLYVGNTSSVTLNGAGAKLFVDNTETFDGTNVVSLTNGTLAVKGTVTGVAAAANGNIYAGTYDFGGTPTDQTLSGDLTVLNGVANAQSITTNGNALNFGLASGADSDVKTFFDGVAAGSDALGSMALTAANSGNIHFNAGDWTVGAVTLTAGDLTVANGNIETGVISATNGAINVTGGALTADSMTLGTGALTVNGGSLTVTNTFASNGQAINIAQNSASEVDLQGTVNTADNSGSTITLGQSGTLKVGIDKAAQDNIGSAINSNWSNKFDGTSAGKVILTGYNDADGDGKILRTDLNAMKTALLGSNSDGITLELQDSNGNIIQADLTGASLNDIEGEQYTDQGVDVTADTVLGNNGATTTVIQQLNVNNGGTETTVAIGDASNDATLRLTGSKDDEAFKLNTSNASGDTLAITVTDGSTLGLGGAGADARYGILDSTVTMDDNSTLNAANGKFTVTKIEAANGGAVTLDNGASLTISDGDIKADSVTASGTGTYKNELIAAAGNIDVTDAVDGAQLTAANTGAAITVGGAVSNNASLTADGDITTGSTVANSTISSANGNIDAAAGAVTNSAFSAANGDISVDTFDGGSLSAANGTITASDALGGSTAVESITAKKLDAQAVALSGGALNLTGTGEDASTVDGAFTAANMTGGSVAEIEFGGTAQISDGSALNFGSLTMTGGDLTIGDAANDTAGSVITVDSLKLGSNTLVINSSPAGSPTKIAIREFNDGAGNTELPQVIHAKDNSLISLGTNDTAVLDNGLADFGFSIGDPSRARSKGVYKSAMLAASPIALGDNGGIAVGSGAAPAVGQLNVEAGSLLVVDAEGIGDNAVVSDVTGGTIAGDVGLLRAKENTKVILAEGTGADTIATDGSTIYVNRLLNGEYSTESGRLLINVAYNEQNDVVYNFSDNLGDLVRSYVESGSGTNAFLDFALDPSNGLTDAQAAQTIEGAAKAPMLIGAPKIALDVATMGSDYAMARTSFAPRVAGAYAMNDNGQAQNIASGDNMANGMNVWIMPMYEHSSVNGLDSGLYELDYDNDFYGVAVGADYTWDNSFRLGATLNFGTGDAETKGDSFFNKTENDYDSIGVGLYAGYRINNFGISGDFMYTHVKNDIDQKIAGYKTLSAEGDTDVISLGLRGEYKIETSAMDIIPHLGIRYNRIDMDDMTFSGELTAFADSANVWQLPVGVTFARDFATESGWNVKPSLDLSLIPAFGDTDMDQRVRFTGVNGIAAMNTEIMDELSGRAQVGIEATKGNFYMGLDYAYQGSSNIDAHQVQANFGFKF